MSIKEKETQLINDLLPLAPREFFEELLFLYKNLPKYPEDKKTPHYVLKGCTNIIYVDYEYKDGLLYFCVHSEGKIIGGIASILLELFSGQTPENILQYQLEIFDRVPQFKNLTVNRSNGLHALRREIIKIAKRISHLS